MDTNLYAINPNGTANWIFPLDSLTHASPAIGPDGTIYIGADNGVAYAIDRKGVAKWKVPLSGDFIESSAAVSSDGTVYFGCGSAQLFALSPDGACKWTFNQETGISASPALAQDGTIYVGAYATATPLIAVSPWGTNLWRLTYGQLAYDAIFSSPAIGADGTIYFGANTRLYAVYGASGLMNSSWPMFGNNPSHTARSLQRALSAPALLADGNVSMNLKVETRRTYQVEYSTNLLDWTELTNFVSETLTNQVADATATNSPERYYRLRSSFP